LTIFTPEKRATDSVIFFAAGADDLFSQSTQGEQKHPVLGCCVL